MGLSRRGFLTASVAAAALPARPVAPVVTIIKPASVGMTELSAAGFRMALGGVSQIYNLRKAN